jgi:chemotaxis signal transduction protein
MAEASAWVLAFDPELRAAVGEREMIHMVQFPVLFEIPDTPSHCRRVLLWQGEIVPVLDVAAWLRGGRAGAAAYPLVGIFAYQAEPETIAYGALPLESAPPRRRVSDEQACALPEQPAGWARIAHACFLDGERKVPVLNLRYLFSDALVG